MVMCDFKIMNKKSTKIQVCSGLGTKKKLSDLISFIFRFARFIKRCTFFTFLFGAKLCVTRSVTQKNISLGANFLYDFERIYTLPFSGLPGHSCLDR